MNSRQVVLLLGSATFVAAMSVLLLTRVHGRIAEIVLGYVPIPLGCISMWLCWRARQKARHKTLVLCYAILLAPFAFSYPAWILFIYVWFRSGGGGPFP